MPPKHSLLFSALALFLAVMLFNASIIQVSAIPAVVIVAILIAAALGFGTGWAVGHYITSRPETPGVDLSSYAKGIFDSWATLWKNELHLIDYLSKLLGRYDLYFIRRAEYAVLDYLHYNTSYLPHSFMKSVAEELCFVQANFVRNLRARLGDLDSTATMAFTGQASNYKALIRIYKNSQTVDDLVHYSNDFENGVRVYYVVTTEPVVVWNCETMQVTGGAPNQRFDMEKYLVIGGQGSVGLYKPGSTSNFPYGYVGITGPGLGEGLWVSLYEGSDSFKVIMNLVQARLSEIYMQAWDFAKSYHHSLRLMGYTSKSQVPNAFICPPPDIMFYDANELVQKANGNFEELTKIYLAYLNSIGEAFDIQSGCLAGGRVTAVTTTYATTYTTVIGGNTTTITTTMQTTYTYTNTTVTTITTTINGTPTTYVTTITNTYTGIEGIPTTITTVIGGQTTTIVTTQTGMAYVTPAGVYVPNIFMKLWNVTVTLPDGSSEYLAELALLDTTETITFRAGECTKLPSPITALAAYPDGRVKVTLYPTNTTLCPGKIIAPGGQEVSSYTYQEKPLDEWVTERYQLESPTFVETKDKLGQ
ncbi:MAG: hypothetical protein QW707_10345, partial [Candidatus Bathyarchaeia archaeon]